VSSSSQDFKYPWLEIGPFACNPKIRFVDPPGSVRPAQFAATTPTEFGCITLDPTPNRNVIDFDVPLGHSQDDDLGCEVSPLELRRPLPCHERPSLADLPSNVCNTAVS